MMARAADHGKLVIYIVCLAVSFCLFLLAGGQERHPLFWALAGLTVAGLAAGPLLPVIGSAAAWRAPQVAATLAAALALADAAGGGAGWPAALVLLFASRVLSELADQRLALAWRAPLQRRLPAAQPVGAALALGGFFALSVAQLLALPAGEAAPPAGDNDVMAMAIISDALHGDTAIHHALILLFCIVMAFIADAWRLHCRDVAALGALARRLNAGESVGTALPAALDERPGARTLLRCLSLVAQGSEPDRATGPSAFRARAELDRASRQFLRGLVPLLPLLGFLGTVIGLSVTLAQLPMDSADAGRAAIDISASLGGLAIKFQTTLLGLAGGMIASVAVALLEKAETELGAECVLLMSAAPVGTPGPEEGHA
ncbi:MAG: MotA/TolQ/ExbB proton channel family protein [Pseudochelatococcus sp.]|jgi:hypothetical protein|uniref:MotA/TolQ/ExbB proton channel family protein n=1 Tax=Pseudochelatococcus sp. TaxID=2020869 RepID=UPI003D948968